MKKVLPVIAPPRLDGTSTLRAQSSSPGGFLITLAGFAGVIGSVDSIGSTARFSGPNGVAMDRAGDVYVADYNNDTIRKITSAGAVSTSAGLAGSSGSALFIFPYGVAL